MDDGSTCSACFLEQHGNAGVIVAGFVAQFAVRVGEVPGDGAAVFLLQVVDHVLQFFRGGAVLGFLRRDEQAAEFQVAGVAGFFASLAASSNGWVRCRLLTRGQRWVVWI